MIIYVSHSTSFNFRKMLYQPLKESELYTLNTIILPHERSRKPYNSKEIISEKKCDIIVAEVSYPSTGQGIELGWANIYEIPIICIYKKGTEYSRSLEVVCDKFIIYNDSKDMIEKLGLEVGISEYS